MLCKFTHHSNLEPFLYQATPKANLVLQLIDHSGYHIIYYMQYSFHAFMHSHNLPNLTGAYS